MAYNVPTINGEPYMEYQNHAEVMLSPYYKVNGDKWNVKLGANVMFMTGEESEFMASPNITADVEVAEKTELYLNAGGKMYSNSLYMMSLMNRYAASVVELAPSLNYLDGTIGIRSGVAPGFWFDIFGGYQITNNELFFVPFYNPEKDAFSYLSILQDNAKECNKGSHTNLSYNRLLFLGIRNYCFGTGIATTNHTAN
jgi:hypothetical protein